MKRVLLLVTAAVLVGVAAWAQLRITSFNSSGELTWTNSISRGFYSVEWASSLAGPWNPLATVADVDWATTNRITLQVSLTNAQALYRVAWILPDPIGVWDYRGYDAQGTLVITGRLSIPSMTLLSTNSPVVYGVRGSWNLQYAGPPTNALWWLGPQIGTGGLGGTVEFYTASLRLVWPTNVYDYNLQLSGMLGPNTYTGIWYYWSWGGGSLGPFSAERR